MLYEARSDLWCFYSAQECSVTAMQSVGPVLEGSGLNGNSVGTAISVAQNSGLLLMLVPQGITLCVYPWLSGSEVCASLEACNPIHFYGDIQELAIGESSSWTFLFGSLERQTAKPLYLSFKPDYALVHIFCKFCSSLELPFHSFSSFYPDGISQTSWNIMNVCFCSPAIITHPTFSRWISVFY